MDCDKIKSTKDYLTLARQDLLEFLVSNPKVYNFYIDEVTNVVIGINKLKGVLNGDERQ